MTVRERLTAARAAWWLRGCERVGRNPRVYGRPSLELEGGDIRIGDRFSIASRPVTSHLVAGPHAVLEIGDDVSIGHGGAVAAYERVVIGAGTKIGPFIIIMDTNFHGNPGDQSVQHECRPVLIGKDCRIGSRVTITRGVTIGDGAEILAGSVVTSSIPAGACAGGGRARVLGPAGDVSTRWDGAAAVVPSILAESLPLPAVPDATVALADLPDWNPAGVERFVSALALASRNRVPASDLKTCRTVADLVVLVDAARHRTTQGHSHDR
jgi:acetyltransferase-like isoleucine patch superfamily enzyme